MQTLGDAFVAEGTFIINISKDNEEPETKNVTITYVDENGKIVGTQTIEVPAGDNNINTSKLTVPEGFELVWTGDLAIEDGAVTVEVKATDPITLTIRTTPILTSPTTRIRAAAALVPAAVPPAVPAAALAPPQVLMR